MNRFVRALSSDLRSYSPARVFVAIASLGTFFIGLGYLIASKDVISGTLLYQALENYGSVKPFGAWTAFVGLMMLIATMRNSRSQVALWSFQAVLLWLFIGALFATEFPESWFTVTVLWPMNFLAVLYARYLAVRPPGKDDDKFDEHVDKTRAAMLD